MGLSHLQRRPGGRGEGPSHSTGLPFPTWGENHLNGQQSPTREANWEGEERGDVRSWSVCPSLVIPAWKQPWAGEQTSSSALPPTEPPPSTGASPCVSLCYCCSVTKSYPTPCDPMDCSTRGSPVLHYLPGLAQTHVH